MFQCVWIEVDGISRLLMDSGYACQFQNDGFVLTPKHEDMGRPVLTVLTCVAKRRFCRPVHGLVSRGFCTLRFASLRTLNPDVQGYVSKNLQGKQCPASSFDHVRPI